MANIRRQEGCCGVRELYNLGGRSLDIIRQVHNAIEHDNLNAAYYMFADRVDDTGNGQKLARYIAKNELGKLIKTPPTYNPQSEHNLEVWLWAIDQEAIAALVEAKKNV